MEMEIGNGNGNWKWSSNIHATTKGIFGNNTTCIEYSEVAVSSDPSSIPVRGGYRISGKGGQSTMRARKILDTPTNGLTTPPNCRDREAISCFLTVKCTISTKF